MEWAFLGSHKPGTHGDSLCTQGQRCSQTPAIRDSTCSNDRDGQHINQAGDETERRDELTMSCGLVTRGNDGITPVLLGAFGVTGVHHGGHDLAAVFVGLIDYPVPLAQSEIDHGNLLLE